MLALTLIQPYAYAVAHLDKNIENRSWKPPARVINTRIAIHAGSKCHRDEVAALRELGHHLPDDLEQGALLCTAIVSGWVIDSGEHSDSLTPVEAKRALRSEWYIEGHYGWVLSSVRVLPRPIRCKGALSLWQSPL